MNIQTAIRRAEKDPKALEFLKEWAKAAQPVVAAAEDEASPEELAEVVEEFIDAVAQIE